MTDPARHRRARTKHTLAVALSAVGALLMLAACTTGSDTGSQQPTVSVPVGSGSISPTAPSTSASPPQQDGPPAAAVAVAPAGATALNPVTPITVSATGGTLSAVTLKNSAGAVVTGSLSADAASWKSTEALGYSKTYTLSATAKNPAGVKTVKTARYITLTPSNQTMPYLERLGGYPLGNGVTYGVAIVPVVHFDEAITDKVAAQQALVVTTTPHVNGSWDWVDDQNVHYRPQTYWPAGTKVTINANVYGVQVGPGLYGQSDASASFTVGRKQLTIADDTAPASVNKVRVYDGAAHVIKTMNTSMGEHTGVTVNGNYINFYTMGGNYTVLAHENPASMCSASYGLPANAPGGYPCENIYWATKISTDGIYLHELDTTVWAQDNGQDVSHGCLNLNQANATWFFQHSLIGDPVEIHGAKGAPAISIWQGGDWSVPWAKWVAGSALH
ncbi:MAG: Ig-like domain-containing protein [Jatrophihabitantaceae bacterium]